MVIRLIPVYWLCVRTLAWAPRTTGRLPACPKLRSHEPGEHPRDCTGTSAGCNGAGRWCRSDALSSACRRWSSGVLGEVRSLDRPFRGSGDGERRRDSRRGLFRRDRGERSRPLRSRLCPGRGRRSGSEVFWRVRVSPGVRDGRPLGGVSTALFHVPALELQSVAGEDPVLTVRVLGRPGARRSRIHPDPSPDACGATLPGARGGGGRVWGFRGIHGGVLNSGSVHPG